ncbi:MAG: AAA family ATPase [Nitrososphaera sp.]|jgi:orc1/cdc6 family replication initiation protein
MDESGILLDESVFDDVFIPERLIGREEHVREIARSLGPAKSGRQITNLFVHGPPGVGKTLVCRRILKEHFADRHAYVNCWSKRTTHKVLEEILLQLGMVVHGRESASELVKKFERMGKKVIVCLDEADQLKDHGILYVLARNNSGIVMISNCTGILADVDGRIRSSLCMNELEFKPYTRDEILSILKERASFGFRPSSISENTLSTVSHICNGDARIGLQILRTAAKEAESKGLNAITIEHIKNAARFARKYRLSYLLSKLNEHQKAIYEILKQNGQMDSGKLFEEYCKRISEPVVDRAYRNYMERMEEMGLVKATGSGRWKRYEIAQC